MVQRQAFNADNQQALDNLSIALDVLLNEGRRPEQSRGQHNTIVREHIRAMASVARSRNTIHNRQEAEMLPLIGQYRSSVMFPNEASDDEEEEHDDDDDEVQAHDYHPVHHPPPRNLTDPSDELLALIIHEYELVGQNEAFPAQVVKNRNRALLSDYSAQEVQELFERTQRW